MARVRMPVPVGIGTVGYGGFGFDVEPSPFAEVYPATTRVHNHPDFRAVAISRGPGHEVVFLRTDTVGVFQQMRRAVVLEVEARLGRPMDDVILMGATHTHGGPGRVVDAGGPFDLIADTFLPEHYDRMVEAMADAVEYALRDLEPGTVGWTWADGSSAISDRRCEDGLDYVNGTMPVLAVSKDDELAAVVMTYAIHGTVLFIDDLTLTQDVSGGIEQAVEDRFDTPVMALMFNSWGADMAPGEPEVPLVDGAERPGGYDQMEQIGFDVADAVETALLDVAWESEPEIWMSTHRVRIDREEIGYADDEFQYPFGAVFCGLANDDEECDPTTTVPNLDTQCIPFNEDYPAPDQTVFSAGQIGATHFVTWPGEGGTKLAEGLLDQLLGIDGVEQMALYGYAQDYLGYSIEEEDWWQGGYESTGAIWGPRQGAYLQTQAANSFVRAVLDAPPTDEPPPIAPFGTTGYTPYAGPTELDYGLVLEDVAGAYSGSDAVIRFSVSGNDPWHGTPLAILEHADGTPVLRPGGWPMDSDGQRFWLDLAVDPPYSEALDVAERSFQWTFQLAARHAVESAGPGLGQGEYRLRVLLRNASSDQTEVVSGPFTWTP